MIELNQKIIMQIWPREKAITQYWKHTRNEFLKN